ncbi:MAG: tyrosine-type recombinase/integrase [Deltaproteobacteria bacterium]|nr:tyrosine-type recombinase/integrase [Deltaproteobacteria bacterium]
MARLETEKSRETISAYRKDLQHFAAFMGERDSTRAVMRLLSLARGDANAAVGDYRDAMIARGLSPPTVNRRLASIRSVVGVGRELGVVDWHLDVAQVPGTRVRYNTKGPAFGVVRDMLNKAREAAAAGAPRDVRNFAILRLLSDLGVRRGSVMSLDRERVNLAKHEVSMRLKGQREGEFETWSLPAATEAALVAWLRIRGDAPGPVFCGVHSASKGKRLTGSAIFQIIREAGARVGVVVHPHSFRHSAITAVLNATGNLRTAQHFGRHKSSRSTELYDDAAREVGDAAARLLVDEYEKK